MENVRSKKFSKLTKYAHFLVIHENTKNTQMYCGLWLVRIQIGCTVNFSILNVEIQSEFTDARLYLVHGPDFPF